MPGITKLIDDTTLEKAKLELKQLGNYSKVSIKLKAIISAKEHGIAQVAKVFNITRASLTNWIKIFQANGANALLVQEGRGKKPKLDDKQLLKIRKWISSDPNITISQLRSRIVKAFDIEISMATVHRIMKDLSFSYITPRPKHYKQDSSKQEEFKKKSEDQNRK